MRLIDGRGIAATIREETAADVSRLQAAGVLPTLAVVVPNDDEATEWYVRSIRRAATRLGIDCRIDHLGDRPAEVIRRLDVLSADPAVHGIICQTPLPEGLLLQDVAAHIAPAKDVDGASVVSLGKLTAGMETFAPATAAAVLEILRRENVPLVGVRAVVIGRSTVVGKPVALLLLAEHATVTVCHSRTIGLEAVCAEADILVAAVGKPRLVGAKHVRAGAVVVDVGTNPTEDGGLVGDVDQAAVSDRAGALTPVPGGVGPVTTMLLLKHTVIAASRATTG